MKVISITPRGYCKGVIKAINAVKNAIKNPEIDKPIYILGYIVHNKFVVNELKDLGVITLDDTKTSRIDLIDEIFDGTVVLSAHGTDPSVKAKLKEKNIPFIDATCEDVEKTFELIKKYDKLGYFIIYIGKHNHPESNAAISLSKRIVLVETIDDIPNNIKGSVFVTNQTTFSFIEIEHIIDRIIDIYPNTLISEEICSATSNRQSAIIEHNKKVDLCYIVGDPRSNNSKNLAIISRNITNTKTFLIESVSDIDVNDLLDISSVSVSSGASTPTYLTNEVIEFLKSYN